MLIPQWESKNLVFTEFSSDEAELAKSIFDSNLNVKAMDPTFREWSIIEYEKLIAESNKSKLSDEQGAFYLRKLAQRKVKWLVTYRWSFMLRQLAHFGFLC